MGLGGVRGRLCCPHQEASCSDPGRFWGPGGRVLGTWGEGVGGPNKKFRGDILGVSFALLAALGACKALGCWGPFGSLREVLRSRCSGNS